jgi:hypothetical protein
MLVVKQLLHFLKRTFTLAKGLLMTSCHFLSSGASGSGWNQTLAFRMMWQVFNHCAAAVGRVDYDLISVLVNDWKYFLVMMTHQFFLYA